jgi:protein gp37
VGYLACFGLLCFPLFASLGIRDVKGKAPLVTATLMIILVVNLLDLIPNSSLTPITWLIAGALSGPAIRSRKPKAEASDVEAGAVPLPA